MFIQHMLTAVDHHHGQASRTIVSGYPAIRGTTMREKAAYYEKKMSWVHEALLREPRGHRNMLGSIITEPVTAESEFGVIFLHPSGMFDGCGDSTFCTAAAAIETGLVKAAEPVTRFSMDSVLGPLQIEADVENGVVNEVRFGNVPSYYVGTIKATLPDGRTVAVHVAFGGLYFGFVDAEEIGLTVDASSQSQIVATAQALWEKLGNGDLADKQTGQPARLDLFTFVQRKTDATELHYVVANVYRPGTMGRTPSGTGTSAHIALRHAQGLYKPGTTFVQESTLGLVFKGTATPCTLSGGGEGVNPVIGTKSYMMGVNNFVLDPSDPYTNGFIVAA